MASITRTQDVSGLSFQDGENKITVTAKALTNYNLDESERSLVEHIETGECKYVEWYYGTEKVGYRVAGRGNSTQAALTIRPDYNGYPVVGIEASAFKGDLNLTSITIPNTVTYIGDGAFQSSGLKAVTFKDDTDDDGITYMVIYFENPGWETPYVDYSYAGNTKHTIDPGVKMKRQGTTNIYSCKVPINISSISFNAGTDKIITEALDVSAEAESMSGCLFKTTSNKSDGEITIYTLDSKKFQTATYGNSQEHNGLVISDRAFKGCTGLTELTLPRRLEKISLEAFAYCTGIKNVSIPTQHRLTYIGNCAFEGCSNLNTVTIPDGLINIGNYAFRLCTNLWAIPGASTICRIGNYAFYNCTGMGVINIPSSVDYIGMCAFSADEEYKIPNTVRYVLFADTYTWFVATDEILELSYEPQLIEPTSMYGTEITGAGNTYRNSNLLMNVYKDYFWHKLKKMIPPDISLSGTTLSMTDRLGVAEYFHVYLNDDPEPKLIVKV